VTETGLQGRAWSWGAAALCVAVCLLPQQSLPQQSAFAPFGKLQGNEPPTPVPLPRSRPAVPPGPVLNQAKTDILEFLTAPFPDDEAVVGTGRGFFNVDEDGKRGRRMRRGRVYWENETYNDQRVLLHIPAGFNIQRPGIIIVFFHGHGAEIKRDIGNRQQLPAQISESRANAVLVAPQFALEAADSNPGKFRKAGSFTRFLREAARNLARLQGDPRSEYIFSRMPVMIVGYSGGYLPIAWILHHNDIKGRLRGVVLLDALYGELDKFLAWIESDRSAFFISAYLGSTRRHNIELQQVLRERNIEYATSLNGQLKPGAIAFLAGDPEEMTHRDFVTQAWATDPIADVLNRLPAEYRRR
jgi:hypothetical protein